MSQGSWLWIRPALHCGVPQCASACKRFLVWDEHHLGVLWTGLLLRHWFPHRILRRSSLCGHSSFGKLHRLICSWFCSLWCRPGRTGHRSCWVWKGWILWGVSLSSPLFSPWSLLVCHIYPGPFDILLLGSLLGSHLRRIRLCIFPAWTILSSSGLFPGWILSFSWLCRCGGTLLFLWSSLQTSSLLSGTLALCPPDCIRRTASCW